MPFEEPKSVAAFNELINQDKLVVVDFHAVWCGPCKIIAPRLESFANQFTDVVFAKVDVDEVTDVATLCNITAMPTILYFKNGIKVAEVIGANVPAIHNNITLYA